MSGIVPTPNDPAPWNLAKGRAAQRYAFEAEAERARGKNPSPLAPEVDALLREQEPKVAKQLGLSEVSFDRVSTTSDANSLSITVTAEDTKRRVRADFLVDAATNRMNLLNVERKVLGGGGSGGGGSLASSLASGQTVSAVGSGGSGASTSKERGPLPVEQGDEPFIGWKRATLHIGAKGIYLTGPYQTQRRMSVEDVATCAKDEGRDHPSPDPTGKCKCGFNAMLTRDLMVSEQGASTGNCALQVELYGRVLVGERGYRAERQRIYAVYMDGDGECVGWLCSNRATHLYRESDEDGALAPMCSWHAERGDAMRTVPLSHFAALLGTEVLWETDIYDPDLDGDPYGEGLWK